MELAIGVSGAAGSSCQCPEEFVNPGCLGHAFDNDRPDLVEPEAIPDPKVHVLTDENGSAIFLIQAFETGRQIRCAAKRCIIHPFGRAEIADHRLADMNAETGEERLQALGFELSVEAFAGDL